MYRRLPLIAVILMLVIIPASAYQNVNSLAVYNISSTSAPYYNLSAINQHVYFYPNVSWWSPKLGIAVTNNWSYAEATSASIYVGGALTGHSYAGGVVPAAPALYDTISSKPNADGLYTVVCANIAGSWCDVAFAVYQGNGVEYANVTFIITDSTNSSVKLSGVAITLSNGQIATTNSTGVAIVSVVPKLSTYTYSLVKAGYTSKFLEPLGLYGVDGGTVYNTMVPGISELPAGYVRTTVYAADGETGNTIVGATLNIKDVQNATWVNATSTATGTIIDVLASHTLDIYGDYPGVYNASMELGATPGGPYYLPMFMYRAAPVGYVYLYVTVRDVSTGLTLLHSPVTAKLPTGATTGENTGTSGTASFLLPNNTVIIIGASSPGYNAQSVSTTTGTVNKHIYVDLIRSTVATPTPVVTDPATGDPITPQPTVDARTNLQKDSDLLNILRSNGENIMWLCILAIMFGLLKMIVKF